MSAAGYPLSPYLILDVDKDISMSTLMVSESGELCLTLRGTAENQILATLRRWPYWRDVTIERDPANAERTLAVTLITDQIYESTVREILRRSFGMTFPAAGGSSEIAPKLLARRSTRGR
ncbi:MAG: hypothetical protein ACJ8CR_23180 [Roseiflexaceae bacterium]